MEVYGDLAAIYLDFARYDAADGGRHEAPTTFEAWATAVAADPDVLAWIGALPPIKRQPNLVFAAARWHGVAAPGPYAGLREALLGDGPDGPIRATILSRATQTNEAGRLATLLPAFALAAGTRPLALLEVGASAGLCLYPDRWSYDWERGTGHHVLLDTVGAPGRLTCRVDGPTPLPAQVPRIAWRGGIDLNPLDVRDADQMAWLEQLVWPEHEDRRERLRRAIDVARADPPAIVRGDLLEELPARVRQASAYGDVVVFHSAVIAYLDDADRLRFDAMMRRLVDAGACHWISNEGTRVLPSVTGTAPPGALEALGAEPATFVLGLDGTALALTHGHGRSMRWLG